MDRNAHDEHGNAQACIAAGMRIGSLENVRPLNIDGIHVPLIMLPENMHVTSLEKFLPQPRRIERTVTFIDPVSFCEYVGDFQDDGHTRLYVQNGNTILAELDDHARGCPSWSTHTARLVLEHSDEWKAWSGMDKKPFGHQEFAEFIEDHISCIAEPSAADLLTTTRKFTVSQKIEVASEIDESGNTEFALSGQVRGQPRNGAASLPRELVLGLRPFQRSDRYEVRVRLRFRYSDHGVKFLYSMVEPDLVTENAIDQICQVIRNTTGLKVLI